jgi:hypothetical protein
MLLHLGGTRIIGVLLTMDEGSGRGSWFRYLEPGERYPLVGPDTTVRRGA